MSTLSNDGEAMNFESMCPLVLTPAKVNQVKFVYQSSSLISLVLMTQTAVVLIWTRDTSLFLWMSLWSVALFFSSQGLWQARKLESIEAKLRS